MGHHTVVHQAWNFESLKNSQSRLTIETFSSGQQKPKSLAKTWAVSPCRRGEEGGAETELAADARASADTQREFLGPGQLDGVSHWKDREIWPSKTSGDVSRNSSVTNGRKIEKRVMRSWIVVFFALNGIQHTGQPARMLLGYRDLQRIWIRNLELHGSCWVKTCYRTSGRSWLPYRSRCRSKHLYFFWG